MARKSRKNLLQPEQATVSVQFPELDEEKIPTAIYGRLSVEDDEDNESMETQIALVQDFINRSSELNYVDITIMKSKFGAGWGVLYGGQSVFRYNNRRIDDFHTARLIAFDLFDEQYESRGEVQPYWDGMRWLYY